MIKNWRALLNIDIWSFNADFDCLNLSSSVQPIDLYTNVIKIRLQVPLPLPHHDIFFFCEPPPSACSPRPPHWPQAGLSKGMNIYFLDIISPLSFYLQFFNEANKTKRKLLQNSSNFFLKIIYWKQKKIYIFMKEGRELETKYATLYPLGTLKESIVRRLVGVVFFKLGEKR